MLNCQVNLKCLFLHYSELDRLGVLTCSYQEVCCLVRYIVTSSFDRQGNKLSCELLRVMIYTYNMSRNRSSSLRSTSDLIQNYELENRIEVDDANHYYNMGAMEIS